MSLNDVLNGIYALLIGVMTYFLKRTISEHDSLKSEVTTMKVEYATKEELKDLRTEIKAISDTINEVQRNSITKTDLIHSIGNIESKLDRLDDKIEKWREGSR